MKVLIDVEGCDHPEKVVRGAVDAAKFHPDYTMVIVGRSDFIKSVVGEDAPSNVEIEHAPDVITNNDSPTHAIRQKPDSSLIRCFTLLNSSDEYIGMVSAGSTGAVLTGATLLVGRIKGVHRPVMVSLMPTAADDKLVCIADTGANVDSKPEFLAQFATMGSLYYKACFGVEKPVVALLSVGTEEKKGDERTKAAHKLIKELPINFVGNMEARDTLTGDYDVVVCDGFAGNVLVKSTEGTAKMVVGLLKQSIKSSFKAKIGALFMKNALKSIKTKMDYHAYGGAAFLGVKKLIVKSHGSTNELSARASVDRIISLYERNIIKDIEAGIAESLAVEQAVGEQA